MDNYITIEQAATKMGFSKHTIRKWLRLKKMPVPFVTINGNIRIRESAIDNYLKRQTINQTN